MTPSLLRRPFARLLVVPLVFFLLIPAVVSARIADRVAILVNDEVITLFEVTQIALAQRPKSKEPVDPAEQLEMDRALVKKAMEQLIGDALIKQEAESLKIIPPRKRVEEWMSNMREELEKGGQKLEDFLSSQGLTMAKFKEDIENRVRVQILMQEKVGRQARLSDEEVASEWRKLNPDQPDRVESRKISHILVRLKEAASPEEEANARSRAEELAHMASTEDFAELARKTSDDPSAARGGDIGFHSRDSLADETFSSTVFSMKPGEVRGPIRSRFGYHIIRLDDTKKVVPDRVKKSMYRIRRRLEMDQQHRLLKTYIEELRRKAFIDLKVKPDQVKLPSL